MIVAHSSDEAEKRSLASAVVELSWITFLLRDIAIPLLKPPQLFTDNTSALHISKNPVFTDYHFI